MDGVAMVTPIFLVGMVMVLSIVMWAIPVRLWVEALSAGVTVSIGTLIGMRLRKVSPAAIVRPLINATKAGLDLDINALEATDVTGPDISGGYIIKRDHPEPDDTTFRTAAENALLIFSEPEVPNAEQIDYLRNYMNTFETTLHGAGSPIRPVGMRSTSMLARGSISIC